MASPTTLFATGDLVTAAQLNGLPVKIADTTVAGASVASIDFTSVPSVYAHLMVVAYLRSAIVSTLDSVLVRLNNDSGASYDSQHLYGTAATVAASETFGATQVVAGECPGSTAGANLFGGLDIWLPHYANAANNKVLRSFSAHKIGTASGNLKALNVAGFWRSNTAISRVMLLANGGNLEIGSRATLYGIPG